MCQSGWSNQIKLNQILQVTFCYKSIKLILFYKLYTTHSVQWPLRDVFSVIDSCVMRSHISPGRISWSPIFCKILLVLHIHLPLLPNQSRIKKLTQLHLSLITIVLVDNRASRDDEMLGEISKYGGIPLHKTTDPTLNKSFENNQHLDALGSSSLIPSPTAVNTWLFIIHNSQESFQHYP